MSVIPKEDLPLLESKALAHIATLGPQGEPQSSPVWFGWDGKYVRFSHLKTRQKYRNVERDPRIALSIVDPENPFHYLEIRGKVARIEPDPHKDFINTMAKKYMGVETYPWSPPGEERVTLCIEPEHITRMG